MTETTAVDSFKPAFIREIEATVTESLARISAHPFIVDGHNKGLTQKQAVRWVKCAGRESRSFPHIIENMIKRTDNPSVIKILKENLDDEYGHGNPEHAHFMHYLHLLDEIGICRKEFEDYHEGAGIKLALSLAYNISMQKSQGVALGYMIVNEGMTWITYSSMKDAFSAFFPDIKTPFFDIHIEVDKHHVAELYKAANHLGDSHLKDILFGVSIGERGMAVLLDEALGVYDYCKDIPKYSTSM